MTEWFLFPSVAAEVVDEHRTMANSPLVSIRIPPETLERIDRLAQKLYPSRRVGRNPNRSQVILAAIDQFLAQHESEYANVLPLDPTVVMEPLNFLPQPESELRNVTPMDEAIGDRPPIPALPPGSRALEPSMREYIDWWFDYFSYMKKLTNVWFKAKQ